MQELKPGQNLAGPALFRGRLRAFCASSVAQWFNAVDFRRRRWRMAVVSSPIHGRWHAVQRPLIIPRLLANAR